MAQFDPLQKAKRAAEQAAQAALQVKDHAAHKAAELRDKAAVRSEQAATLAADVREQASSRATQLKDRVANAVVDLKDAALAGVKNLADDLNAHLPALREAGYTLTHVALELGITPKMKATFAAAPDISQERVDQVVEEHKEAHVTVALLRALHGAYRLQNSIRIAGMKPCDIELELGVPPAVVVKFS
jgi:hypothetical protein